MNLHRRAKTCPESRALLVRRVVEEAWPIGQASVAAGISRQTALKWLRRYAAEGEAGLLDRSSRPRRSPRRLSASREELVIHLRRQYRLPAQVLAELTGIPRSTLGRVLRRHRLSRAMDLEPKPAVHRYERQAPGELIHLDIKKLGKINGVGHRIHGDRSCRQRGLGWEFAHVAIDDYSRLAYIEVLSDERGITTAGFLRRALEWFRERGIEAQRILTDNGCAYVSHIFAERCRIEAVRHLRTRPYTPRTNGKAERLIQTALREWAYAKPYTSSQRRLDALPAWLHFYNYHRRHTALGHLPPASRVNNLLSTNS
jgi:transposase InsO family protein